MALGGRFVKLSEHGPAGALSHYQPLPHPSSTAPLGELGEHSCCVLFTPMHACFLPQNWCMSYMFSWNLKKKKNFRHQILCTVKAVWFTTTCYCGFCLLWLLWARSTLGQNCRTFLPIYDLLLFLLMPFNLFWAFQWARSRWLKFFSCRPHEEYHL